MSDVVIQVESLWKKYRLGVLGTGTLSHDLNRWWHQVRGKPDPYAKVGAEAPRKIEDGSSKMAKGNSNSDLPSPSSNLLSSTADPSEGRVSPIDAPERRGKRFRYGASKNTFAALLHGP